MQTWSFLSWSSFFRTTSALPFVRYFVVVACQNILSDYFDTKTARNSLQNDYGSLHNKFQKMPRLPLCMHYYYIKDKSEAYKGEYIVKHNLFKVLSIKTIFLHSLDGIQFFYDFFFFPCASCFTRKGRIKWSSGRQKFFVNAFF